MNERMNARLEDARKWPASSGKTQYLRYLKGLRLTQREAIHAKCAECCCGYRDGKYDCEVPGCPLHALMPYRGKARDGPVYPAAGHQRPPRASEPHEGGKSHG